MSQPRRSSHLLLTPRDYVIVDAVARFRGVSQEVLTAQVMELPATSTAGPKRLRRLAVSGLVSRVSPGWGRSHAYTATSTGLSLTMWSGLIKAPRRLSISTLGHRMAVAEVALRYERAMGWVAIGEDIINALSLAHDWHRSNGTALGPHGHVDNEWQLDPQTGVPLRVQGPSGVVNEAKGDLWTVPLDYRPGGDARYKWRLPDAALLESWEDRGARRVAVEVETSIKPLAEYTAIMRGYQSARSAAYDSVLFVAVNGRIHERIASAIDRTGTGGFIQVRSHQLASRLPALTA